MSDNSEVYEFFLFADWFTNVDKSFEKSCGSCIREVVVDETTGR